MFTYQDTTFYSDDHHSPYFKYSNISGAQFVGANMLVDLLDVLKCKLIKMYNPANIDISFELAKQTMMSQTPELCKLADMVKVDVTST